MLPIKVPIHSAGFQPTRMLLMNIHKATGSTFSCVSGADVGVAADVPGRVMTALGWPQTVQNFAESLIS